MDASLWPARVFSRCWSGVAFGQITFALLVPSVVPHAIAHGDVPLRHGGPPRAIE